jgi:hypothetical protein
LALYSTYTSLHSFYFQRYYLIQTTIVTPAVGTEYLFMTLDQPDKKSLDR